MSRATMQMMYNGLFVNSVSVDGKIFCKEPMKKIILMVQDDYMNIFFTVL